MSEFNFDKLKSVKTPEKWIENALNIPNKKNKPAIIFFRPALIGSAAALVIVAAALITIFLQSGSHTPVSRDGTVIPIATSATSQESTAENVFTTDNTAPTNSGSNTIPSDYTYSEVVGTSVAHPVTEPKENTQPSQGVSSPTQPVTEPREATQPEPTKSAQPTSKSPDAPSDTTAAATSADKTERTTAVPAYTTEAVTVNNEKYFLGVLEFEIPRGDDLYYADYDNLMIEISTRDGSYLCRPFMEETVGGSRTVRFAPYANGIKLENNRRYTVTIADTDVVYGEDETYTFSFTPNAYESIKTFYI